MTTCILKHRLSISLLLCCGPGGLALQVGHRILLSCERARPVWGLGMGLQHGHRTRSVAETRMPESSAYTTTSNLGTNLAAFPVRLRGPSHRTLVLALALVGFSGFCAVIGYVSNAQFDSQQLPAALETASAEPAETSRVRDCFLCFRCFLCFGLSPSVSSS